MIAEDRLTEMMATALEAHRGFAGKLYESVFEAPVPDGLFADAYTQYQPAPDARVDLVVEFVTGTGRRTLWLENKIWAEFQHRQLERYADAAGDQIDVACLLPSGREGEVPAGTTTLTWHDVATWVDACGRAHAPGVTDWRAVAFTPGTPVEIAVLADFLEEIERQTGVTMRGLTDDDARALSGISDALERGQALLDGGIAAAKLVAGQHRETLIQRNGSYASQHVEWTTDAGTWRRLDDACQPEVFWSGDGYYSGRTGRATISVGITIPLASEHRLLDGTDELERWRSQISQHGFEIGRDNHWLRVFAHWPVDEVIAERPTLTQQASALGAWLRENLEAIEQMPPPDLGPSNGQAD